MTAWVWALSIFSSSESRIWNPGTSGGTAREGQPGAFGEGLVLRKIGATARTSPPGTAGRQHGHQLRGRSAAQKQLAGRDVRAETGVQVVGNGLPGGHVSAAVV